MIKSRRIEPSDFTLLSESLRNDEYHKTTTPDFFVEKNTSCNVYEDELGAVCFVRGSNALRLDIQYVNNRDTRRNLRVMLEGFDKLSQKAKENGYTEVIFNTNSPLLAEFCKKRFGFIESNGELRKLLI